MECAKCKRRTENLKRCTGCYGVSYCTRTCQRYIVAVLLLDFNIMTCTYIVAVILLDFNIMTCTYNVVVLLLDFNIITNVKV
jgi:hypothetical protein